VGAVQRRPVRSRWWMRSTGAGGYGLELTTGFMVWLSIFVSFLWFETADEVQVMPVLLWVNCGDLVIGVWGWWIDDGGLGRTDKWWGRGEFEVMVALVKMGDGGADWWLLLRLVR
jgi:hypothetical protein